MSRDWCAANACGIRLAVQIAPNAKKTEIVGVFDDLLKIRLQAPPVEGRANDALIRFIAEALDVPRSTVRLTHGHTSRRKLLEIIASNITADSACRTLTAAATGNVEK